MCFSCISNSDQFIYVNSYDSVYYGQCETSNRCDLGNMPRISAKYLCFLDYQCPFGYFMLDYEGFECVECHVGCESCVGAFEDECLSCYNGEGDEGAYRLLEKEDYRQEYGKCVKSCEDGYFEMEGVCYKCAEGCAQCDGFFKNDCIVCAHETPIKAVETPDDFKGICTSECVNGAYDEYAKICIYQGTCVRGMIRQNEKCVPAKSNSILINNFCNFQLIMVILCIVL
jgi:hypothetical protein